MHQYRSVSQWIFESVKHLLTSALCVVGTTTTEIINHRHVSPDGLRCEFLVRKIVRNLLKPVTEAPRPPPPTVSKRGRTLRPKINLNLDDEEEEIVEKGPRVFETWCPEVRLNCRERTMKGL